MRFVFGIFFVVFEPLVKVVDDCLICLVLDPRLKVPHDILVVQAAQIRDLSPDALVLLGVFIGQFDFLDSIYVPIESMPGLVDDTETSSAYLLQLLKVIRVS